MLMWYSIKNIFLFSWIAFFGLIQVNNEIGPEVVEDLEIAYGYDEYIKYAKYGKWNFAM